MRKIRNVYSKSKLDEKYGKYHIICHDGELQDDKLYIIEGFKQHLGIFVVQVEEVQFCK